MQSSFSVALNANPIYVFRSRLLFKCEIILFAQIIRLQLHRLALDCDDNDTFEVTSVSSGDVTRERSLLKQCESYRVDFMTDLEADAVYTDVNNARVHLSARMNDYKDVHMKYEVLGLFSYILCFSFVHVWL